MQVELKLLSAGRGTSDPSLMSAATPAGMVRPGHLLRVARRCQRQRSAAAALLARACGVFGVLYALNRKAGRSCAAPISLSS